MKLNKNKTILITGSRGFIGSNLFNHFKKTKEYKIYGFNRKNLLSELDLFLNKIDVIFHFAAVNRPKHQEEFKTTNIDLTTELCKKLKYYPKISLFFASSTQVTKNNLYGKSKKRGEEICLDLSKNYPNEVFILRFPGVFGKGCKPNYNSVVATFCYNVINKIELNIIEKNKIIELVHIDDICNQLHESLNNPTNDKFIEIKKKYKLKIYELANIIQKFGEEDYKLRNEFERKLYKTYLSYK